MTVRIGLGISSREVRAVAVRDGRIGWRDARVVDEPGALLDAIAHLLHAAPRPRFGRRRVWAAIGPSMAHVKQLRGIPDVHDALIVERLVRANARKFFVEGNGSDDIAVARISGWWATAVNGHIPALLQAACARTHSRCVGYVPAVSALATMSGETVAWRDGDIIARLVAKGAAWISTGRYRADDDVTIATSLTGLGADERFADAFAAVVGGTRLPLFVAIPNPHVVRAHAVSRVATAAVGLLALAAAVSARGVRASRQLAGDTERLETLRRTAATWAPLARQLKSATASLDEVARFSSGRRSPVEVLAVLTHALPDSTAIVMLRVDSAGGSATLLSTAAGTVIPRLSDNGVVASPRVMGAVTREYAGATPLQRMTVRFSVASSQRHPR
ncbi:MAG TPA: hypothetical protein VKH19_16230 [Gemmatimonadaceae bacterium]|nr:hypothetical protein [Gemmatimonadaceae bacterium]